MHPLGIVAFFAALAPAPATSVDFRLIEAAPAASAPQVEPAPLPSAPTRRAGPPVGTSPRVPLAEGFGNQVPLAFAARQIVPHGVAIRLGTGVDPNVPVTWAGGKPWPQVLTAAVASLGYRVSVTPTAATIGAK